MRTNSGTTEALVTALHHVTKTLPPHQVHQYLTIYAAVEGEPAARQKQNVYQQGYPSGVKLTTKELRDYFATQVSAQVTDPNTVKELMRHTSLTTTSRYVRTVVERMKQSRANPAAIPGGKFRGNSGGGNSPRKKYPKAYVDQTGGKAPNCAE